MLPTSFLLAWAGLWVAARLLLGRITTARLADSGTEIELEWWRCTVRAPVGSLAARLVGRHRRALRRWFTAGLVAGLLAGACSVALLLSEARTLLRSAIEPSAAGAVAKAAAEGTPRLQLALPGVTLPASHALPLWLALAGSLVVHEAGHALAAAAEGVHVSSAGLSLVLLLPAAFVCLDDADLATLSRPGMLRVACAGAWHNAALAAACWGALRLAPASSAGVAPVQFVLQQLRLLLGYTASLSAALALLNMAPVHALDGAAALQALALRPHKAVVSVLPREHDHAPSAGSHGSHGSSRRRAAVVRWALHCGTALYGAVLALHVSRLR